MNHQSTDLPEQYCPKCGKQLNRTVLATYYSMNTGKPYNHWLWKCPDNRWYNHHASFKTDEYGSSYGYEN